MNSINFIKKHLIAKIGEQVKYKQAILKHDGFYYFDVVVTREQLNDRNMRAIDRITRYNPFEEGVQSATSWYILDGRALMSIYQRLKDNDFYIYKEVEGKTLKMRVKKHL